MTFEDCLNIAQNASDINNLLLGNGFSIDLFPEKFKYKSLVDQIEDSSIRDIFQSLSTYDFEYVLQILANANLVIEHYKKINYSLDDLKDQIESDSNKVKQALIKILAKSHPLNQSGITGEQYRHCGNFLGNFNNGKKYTLNYDLLIYWVYMYFRDSHKINDPKCKDGFRKSLLQNDKVIWLGDEDGEQDLYYLHGALHFYFSDTGLDLEKLTWSNAQQNITEQIQYFISNGRYPVFISEGSKEYKLQKIRNNLYLRNALSSLQEITGNLFIYGHSLRDEDDHIFNTINKNPNIKIIFISIFGSNHLPNNVKISQKVESWKEIWKEEFPDKAYYLYKAETANVWGNNA